MFDPILVPLDGSQLADCVLPHVVAIAHSFDSKITLLRMLEKNHTGTSAQLFDLLNWQINKTKAALYLEKTKAQFQELSLQARTVVMEGLVAEGITEYAQNQGMKLIVLSSHGRNGLTQWGISSITQKIILSAQTSLLIVRAHQYGDYSGELSATPLYQRILVPLDGSQRAENVLPIILPNWRSFTSLKFILRRLCKRQRWRVKCRQRVKILIYPTRLSRVTARKPRVISNK